MGVKIDEIPKLDDDITTDRQSNVMVEVQLAMRIYLGFGATVCLLMLPAGLVAQTGGQPGGGHDLQPPGAAHPQEPGQEAPHRPPAGASVPLQKKMN